MPLSFLSEESRRNVALFLCKIFLKKNEKGVDIGYNLCYYVNIKNSKHPNKKEDKDMTYEVHGTNGVIDSFEGEAGYTIERYLQECHDNGCEWEDEDSLELVAVTEEEED